MIQSSTIKEHATLGPYRLGATLGKGTYAKVKVAYCEHTKRDYAIKIFKKSQRTFNSELFQKEVACLNLVKHKNIPAFFDSFESIPYVKKNGKQYEVAAIVMEYMQNGELYDYLVASEEGFPEDVARTLFKSLIETVGDIHSQGIAHRDLKPENLLLTKDFQLKVGDFGAAAKFKNEEGLIPLKGICGTMFYMAPEIWSGEVQNGAAVDIWSCGVILCILMTLELPFNYPSYYEITPEHCNYFWDNIENRSPNAFSDEFKDLLDSMLAFDPSKRATIQQIKEHPWFNGLVFNSEDMDAYFSGLKEEVDASRLENRQREKEEAAKAKAWAKKMQDETLKATFGLTGMSGMSGMSGISGMPVRRHSCFLFEPIPSRQF